jgi:selenocysteine lyase/cysteine desulfurase
MKRSFSPFSDEELKGFRDGFSHIGHGITYLNHAAVAPLSDAVRAAMEQYLDQRNRTHIENFELAVPVIEECRDKIQKLINAPGLHDTAFTCNTSDGISLISSGLPWQNGDEVLLNTMEFPSNVQPWRALESKGVKLNFVQVTDGTITADQIEKHINSKTRVVAISAVQFMNGYLADLEAIGQIFRNKNIFFVVDAIQALGQVPIDVQKYNIDALATGGHKWLMSPIGTGFLYMNDRLRHKLNPVRTGWFSVEVPWDLLNYDQPFLDNTTRFEAGSPNMIGLAGMNASLNTLLGVGVDKIQAHLRSLTDLMTNQILSEPDFELYSPVENRHRSGIVTFKYLKSVDGEKVINELKREKLVISYREGYFRVSPHFYSTQKEIENAFIKITTIIRKS